MRGNNVSLSDSAPYAYDKEKVGLPEDNTIRYGPIIFLNNTVHNKPVKVRKDQLSKQTKLST